MILPHTNLSKIHVFSGHITVVRALIIFYMEYDNSFPSRFLASHLPPDQSTVSTMSAPFPVNQSDRYLKAFNEVLLPVGHKLPHEAQRPSTIWSDPY